MNDPADIYGDDAVPITEIVDRDPARDANRIMRDLRKLVRQRDEFKQQLTPEIRDLETELAQLRGRADMIVADYDDRITKAVEEVKSIHRAVLERDEEKLTWKLAYGTLSAKRHQPEIVLDEPRRDALIEWVRNHAAELLTETKVVKFDANAVKRRLGIAGDKVVDSQGEPVEGMKVKPGYVEQKVTYLEEPF